MAGTKLRAGKGARAIILTRYIKPMQPVPGGDKKHRSEVILEERLFDSDNKPVYKFKYALSMNSVSPELHGKGHWVKVIQEGHHHDLFDGPGEPLPDGKEKEPKIKWRHSRARALLYNDIEKGIIEFDDDGEPEISLKEIYAMRPEYCDYFYSNFDRRLKSLRGIFEKQINRAEDDVAALENYMNNHTVSLVTWKGLIQWQGSEAQEYVIQAIEEGIHKEIGYRALYDKRKEYFEYFDYPTFKDKVRQEVKTKKALHTKEVRAMQGVKAT